MSNAGAFILAAGIVLAAIIFAFATRYSPPSSKDLVYMDRWTECLYAATLKRPIDC